MRLSPIFPALLAFLPVLFSACTPAGDCGEDLRIDQVFPAPVLRSGMPFVVRGTGFDHESQVRLGRLELSSLVDLTELENFVKLPEGLLLIQAPQTLLGSQELSVDAGDCIGRADVDLVEDLLPGQPGNLPFFFVPPVAASFPASFSNQWIDANDPDHTLNIQGNSNANGEGTVLTNFGSSENHNKIDSLNFNDLFGYIRPPYAFLVIVRNNNGGATIPRDTLFGRYIPPAGVNPAAKDAMWLFSIKTGKTLIIYKNN